MTGDEGQVDKLYSSWKEKSQSYFSGIDNEEELIDKITLFYDSRDCNFSEG